MSYNRSMVANLLLRFAAVPAGRGNMHFPETFREPPRRGDFAIGAGGDITNSMPMMRTATQRGAPAAQLMRRLLAEAGPDDSQPHQDGSGAAAEVQESRPELKPPPLYKVVLVNDDYTPMEFVVEVLQTFFYLDRTKATQIMLYVHTRGKGVAGVYTYEIAETKVAQVNEYSRKHQHPLLCTMEEA